MRTRTILFVCSGNTCRSPMAEAIARHWTDNGLLGPDRRPVVASAGTMAAGGLPATAETVTALARWDIEHRGLSRPLSEEMVRDAEVVLCMTHTHVQIARSLVADSPEQQSKIHMLDPAGDIEDPMGTGQAGYNELAERLMDVIPRRLKELLDDEDRPGR